VSQHSPIWIFDSWKGKKILFYSIQTGSGAQAGFYSVDNGNSDTWSKTGDEWNYPPP